MKKIIISACAVILLAVPAWAAKQSMKVGVTPVPPSLTATVSFSEPSGNDILDAGETGKLTVTVKNTGKGDAFDVTARLTAAKRMEGLDFPRDVAIGTVPAGKSVAREIALTATEECPTGTVSISVDLKEANGFDPDPMRLSFKTRAFEPPKLIVADMGIQDQNGNGRVEPSEIVELTVRIQNVGHGDAREVTAEVQLGENVFVAADSPTRFGIGNLKAGQFKDIKFSFYTNRRIANGQKIPITVKLGEVRPRFAAQAPLNLVMNSAQRQLAEVVVKGDEGTPKGAIQVAGGLSVDVDTDIPEGRKAAGPDDVAVVIGNRNYSASGSPDVKFANRDAQVMKEYLIRLLGYSPANIIYAEDATLAKFNEIFGSERNFKGKLFRFVRPGARVFVYYVGHGAPDLESQEAFFVPVDANPQSIRDNGYRLQTFYDNLAKIPASGMTVVIDACFSGNSDKGMLFKNISPALVKVKKEYQGPKNAVLITSAAADQVSTWYEEKRHSLFTYYFLKGLQGAADERGDGKITVAEMDAYLKKNVPYMAQRLGGNEQTPVITGNAGEVIAILKKN